MNEQRNKNWNEQSVIEEIRAWQELGKPLYSHYMRQNYQELSPPASAISAPGVPPSKPLASLTTPSASTATGPRNGSSRQSSAWRRTASISPSAP